MLNIMKTSELTGAALDWAVAICEESNVAKRLDIKRYPQCVVGFKPSSDWAQGGPIIEREKIAIDCDGAQWVASANDRPVCYSAKTPLIAAMRCYVASKLGDNVDIPKELM